MVNPILLKVGYMDIGGNAKNAAENKAYVLGLEKRVASLEAYVQNISSYMQRGSLAPEQEQRVAAVEDRLENAEDLLMVSNLDLIKMKDTVEKLPAAGTQQNFFAGANAGTNATALEKRINHVESILKSIEDKALDANAEVLGKKMNDIENLFKKIESKPSGTSTLGLEKRVNDVENVLKKIEGRVSGVEARKEVRVQLPANAQDMQSMKNDISQLRTDFLSFKVETEEVVKAIISSIKRLSDVLK